MKKIQSKIGKVVSLSGPKTMVVAVTEVRQHPKYKKRYRKTKHFHVHSLNKDLKVGDQVTLIACRPLSRLKCWKISNKK